MRRQTRFTGISPAVWKECYDRDGGICRHCGKGGVLQAAHGQWIEKTAPEGCRYFECSNCGAHENRHTAIKGYYCWRCGAKMDGDDSE